MDFKHTEKALEVVLDDLKSVMERSEFKQPLVFNFEIKYRNLYGEEEVELEVYNGECDSFYLYHRKKKGKKWHRVE